MQMFYYDLNMSDKKRREWRATCLHTLKKARGGIRVVAESLRERFWYAVAFYI